MGRRSALIGLHGAVVLFGMAGLFGKWILLSPLWIVLARTTIAAITLGVFRVTTRKARSRFDARLMATGAVLALHWVAFFTAVQVANVATALLGFASFPLFVLALERALFGRGWTRREGATAGVVTIGLGLLVPEFSITNPAVQGLAWGVLSGVTFALLAVLNRRWVAEGSSERGGQSQVPTGADAERASASDTTCRSATSGERRTSERGGQSQVPTGADAERASASDTTGRSATSGERRTASDVAFWQDLWAAVTLLPIVLAAGPMPSVTSHDIVLLLVLGIVCTAVAHTLFIACLKVLTAHTASVVAALEPVYGIVLALVLLGEIPDRRTIVGAALIIGAALSATWHDSAVEPARDRG